MDVLWDTFTLIQFAVRRCCGPTDKATLFAHISLFFLEFRGTSINIKLVHWPLMGGCYVWHSEEGTWRSRGPPRPLLAVPNVTVHPSTASVPITASLCNGRFTRLHCSFNVAISDLKRPTDLFDFGTLHVVLFRTTCQLCFYQIVQNKAAPPGECKPLKHISHRLTMLRCYSKKPTSQWRN